MQIQTYRTFSLLMILALLGAFAATVVRAQTNGGMRHEPSSMVRMAVDPTVLPPVENPEQAAMPLDEESVSVTPVEEAEPAEADPATVLPLAPGKQAEAPAAEVIPAPKPAPVPSSAPTSAPMSKPAAPAAKAAPQGKATINKITLESTDSRFVITIHCDRPVGDTSYLNLNNPRRFVVDLRQPWAYEAANVLRASSGKVKYVVTGSHPDRFRLVVHFRTPPKGRLEPTMKRNGNALVISVPLQ